MIEKIIAYSFATVIILAILLAAYVDITTSTRERLVRGWCLGRGYPDSEYIGPTNKAFCINRDEVLEVDSAIWENVIHD